MARDDSAAAADASTSTATESQHLIDGDGRYFAAALLMAIASCGQHAAGAVYQTIAIMGPQSSGKSTLMNALVSFCEQEVFGADDVRIERASSTCTAQHGKDPLPCRLCAKCYSCGSVEASTLHYSRSI